MADRPYLIVDFSIEDIKSEQLLGGGARRVAKNE
jgi:hypothetical protein